VLLDFGSARQALGEQTKTLTSLISPGYAPFEQYFSKGDEQGEWTDIYGLGATLYRAVAGVAPQDAVDRSNSILKTSRDTIVNAVEIGKGKYSERFLKAIDHAIQFRREDRPQTIAEWRAEFELPEDPIKEAFAIEKQVTQPGETVLARQQETKSKSIKIIALVTLFMSISVALYFLGSTIVSDWQQVQEESIARQQQAEDEQRLAILEQKRFKQETAQRLAEEKRIAEEKKQLEEEKHLAELEQQRQEKEAKRLAEVERKEQEAERIALEEKRRLEEENKQRLVEEQKRKEAEEARQQAELEIQRQKDEKKQEEVRLAELERKQRIESAKKQEELLLARMPESEVKIISQNARFRDRSLIEKLEKIADSGNKYAQAELGSIYYNERKYAEGFELLEKSTAQGVASAQSTLGYAYNTGYGGLKINKLKAIEFFKKAAAQGDKNAIAWLKSLGIRSGW